MYKKYFKRLFDIVLSTMAFSFLVFITMIVGFAIKMEDNGPVFYKSLRLGKDGKLFTMYKFRSMKVNAPDIRCVGNSTFNSLDDPRLTIVGKFIRKTSIDELPQIINVLRGDMSIIGPRPDLPEAISKYTSETILKISVKPGITGYNQAYFRNSVSTFEKFKNDVYYVKNLSVKLDIKIFVKTISSVILRKNIFSKNDPVYKAD